MQTDKAEDKDIEMEDGPTLAEVLRDQARARKLIDPDALFTSVRLASLAESATSKLTS